MKKNILKKKIILGTANFTQRYGVRPVKVNLDEAKKILNLAKKNNLNILDTADSYLDDISFFKYTKKKFKIISKVKPDIKWISLQYCKDELDKQMIKLDSKIEILLLHDVNFFFLSSGIKVFKNLNILKKKGYFKKIGFSIYSPDSLEFLITKYDIDVIQCPYNILDKRIVDSGWLYKLKKKNIEVHVRSIFLQGLLVNKKISNKKYFKKWKNKILNWFKFLTLCRITPIEYILNDLLDHDFDRIIIGINNYDNLKEILNYKIKNNNKSVNFKIKDLKLIDPRRWK